MNDAKFFKSNIIDWSLPENNKIFQNFKAYKSGEGLPLILGRDVPYHRPSDALYAGLFHIHLGNFNRHTDQYHRTSDDCLVYTKGLFTPSFLVIDILSPDAHNRAKSMDTMLRYIDIANRFRNQF